MEQPHELASGTTFGQYTIDALIGAGGMGQVYRATDRRLKRTVAIKVLTPALAHDAGFAARFEREARLLASLNHPNIAAIYGMESAGAIEGLVLEFVEGETVADRLASGPMPVAEALVVARQIALALEAAHEQGIVHRDLKPANVKITPNGLVKVLDFGLARAAFDAPEALTFAPTQAGVILGTPAYMSPEQARGQAVDKRTDIWSFGCVLYEMLAGRGAFSAGTASDSLVKLLERAPDWTALPASVPEPIRRLVARCLDKNPTNRLHDIADARIEIAAIEASPVGDASRVDAIARPARNLRFVGVGAIALIAAAIGAGASWTLFRDRPTTGVVLRRLTVDSSLTTDQAISRDGRLIAYASDRGGANLDIWVQQVAGGSAVQITNDPADDVEPTFSPDGSQLAFRSDRDGGGIYIVSTLGGSARRVADRGRRPRWSPDGKYIAYWTGLDTAFLMTQADGPRTFIVSASGGEPRAIAADLSTAWAPVWNADSTALLILGSRDVASPPDWCVVSLNGGAMRSTNADAAIRKSGLAPSPDSFFTPEAWTADGRVLFSARLGDSTNIWQLAVGRGGTIAAAPVRLTSGANVETTPAIDDASHLVYSVLTSNVDLWSLPVDTIRAKATGGMTRLTDDSAMDAYPWLTPDGSKLTFMSNRSGNYDLWVREMATGKETTLAAHVVFPGVPITAKDGSRVIFESAVDHHLFSLPLSGIGAGPSAVRLCDDCNPWDVSADGKWTLDSTPEDTLIRAREVASGKTTTFLQARSGEIVGRLRISPDDKWVAFTHRSGGGIQQNVVPFRPGGLIPEAEWIPITTSDSASAIATWSPDSRMVYYFSDRDGHVCLWAQPIDTATGHPAGDAIDVWHFHDARHSLGRVALPLRGMTMVRDRIVLSLAESTAALWLAAPGGARP